jgi:hypothetical protein
MIKIFSHIVLSSLLILSSAGLTINMHFCHDELIDMAIMAPAHSCCDVGDQDTSCHQESESSHSNHCSDESIEIESSSDFNISVATFDFSNERSFDLLNSNQSLTENLRIAETATFEIPNFEKPPLIKEVDLSQIQLFII